MTKPREKAEVTEIRYRGRTTKLKHWPARDQWETDLVYHGSPTRDKALDLWREKIDQERRDELESYWHDDAFGQGFSLNGTTFWRCPRCAALTDDALKHDDWHVQAAQSAKQALATATDPRRFSDR